MTDKLPGPVLKAGGGGGRGGVSAPWKEHTKRAHRRSRESVRIFHCGRVEAACAGSFPGKWPAGWGELPTSLLEALPHWVLLGEVNKM